MKTLGFKLLMALLLAIIIAWMVIKLMEMFIVVIILSPFAIAIVAYVLSIINKPPVVQVKEHKYNL